ncbi:hypothetical protein J8273_1330 [Carpediemonas membranifera]|uniref:Uncharacterized protein n=1 Tax=Carpediemonas membranifera TaxID=201153 RepID=A0A8J6C0W2_9EUKA|nr:hypothetical protein J8273_1330 [Carpediemonas membranifera]|eukprot:KAG9396981.1 hypothetical protein J8273_1330 [Carpediemonas membranifera]
MQFDNRVLSDDIKVYFYLWPWPDKKQHCGRMKSETIEQLDVLWASNWSRRKDSEKIKQCKRCGSFFAPGTSNGQLMRHAQRCNDQILEDHLAFKGPITPPAQDSFTIFDAPSIPPPMLSTGITATYAELTAHIESESPLAERQGELESREAVLDQLIQSQVDDKGNGLGNGEVTFKRLLDFYQAIQYSLTDIGSRIRRTEAEEALATIGTMPKIPKFDQDPIPGPGHNLPLPPIIQPPGDKRL